MEVQMQENTVKKVFGISLYWDNDLHSYAESWSPSV